MEQDSICSKKKALCERAPTKLSATKLSSASTMQRLRKRPGRALAKEIKRIDTLFRNEQLFSQPNVVFTSGHMTNCRSATSARTPRRTRKLQSKRSDSRTRPKPVTYRKTLLDCALCSAIVSSGDGAPYLAFRKDCQIMIVVPEKVSGASKQAGLWVTKVER